MPDLCKGCGLPVKDGDVRYVASEHRGEFWHWNCHKKAIDLKGPLARIRQLSDEARAVMQDIERKTTIRPRGPNGKR